MRAHRTGARTSSSDPARPTLAGRAARAVPGRRSADAGTSSPQRDLTPDHLPGLRASGWALPPSLARDDVLPQWTRLGVVDGRGTSLVDPRGLVTPREHTGGYSVDWWVGAEDRWHLPTREPGITQRRLDGAPVVETTMRIPGGEVVHRAYAVRGPAYPGSDEWIVVEVENRSPVPVALAWVVRPYTPVRLTAAGSVDLEPVDPQVPNGVQRLTVLGDVGGLLPRAPSRWARAADGIDPLHQVTAGQAHLGPVPGPDGPAPGEATPSPVGGHLLASAAYLTPLAHTATARLLLLPHGVAPPGPPDEDGERTRIDWPAQVPTAEAVARGWSALADRGPRVELPDPILAEALAAARRSLPLCHRVQREPAASDQAPPPARHRIRTGGDGDPVDRSSATDPVGDRMEVLAALAWWGDASSVERLLATWPEDQRRGGGFGSPEATAAALRALATYTVASGDDGPARAWLPEVGGAVESLGKAVRKRARGAASTPAEAADRALALAEGFDAAALVLARLGQPEAAARLAVDAERSRLAAGGPDGPGDPGPDLDAPSTTPRALAAAAVAAARAGRPSGALWALLRRASSTWTWSDPERWAGDDGLVHARLLDAVARLLVDDRPSGPALLPWLPPTWWGQGWEVHGAPTRWGVLSYAVRWHGDRPAVLWELADGSGGDPAASEPPLITAPALDPGWSSRDRAGEALLGPVALPPEIAAEAVGPGAAPSGTGAVAVAAPPRSVWRPQDAGPDSPPSPSAPPGPGGDPDGPSRPDAPAPPDGGSFS